MLSFVQVHCENPQKSHSVNHNLRKIKVPFSAQTYSYTLLNLIQIVWKIHLILSTISDTAQQAPF